MLTRAIDSVYRRDGGRILASLIRQLGDFELAEDALQDAYEKALRTWPRDGLPSDPAAWLFVAARRCGLDRLRRAPPLRADADALDRLAAPRPIMAPSPPRATNRSAATTTACV